MSIRRVYHQGDDKFAVASMKKYFEKKQEMDKLLDKLINPHVANKKLKILDAGCGIGHSLYFLNNLSPESVFLGVDQTPVYIKEAKRLFGQMPNISFVVSDVEDLSVKYSKTFDVTISRAVISWLPDYEEFVKSLMSVTKRHIFISSLFYDGDVDFFTKIKMYKGESGRSNTPAEECRNVYSLPRFKRYMKSLGAKRVQVYDFEIGIDLPRRPLDQMSTYTVKLNNGKRLQISGAVLMYWKWARIDL